MTEPTSCISSAFRCEQSPARLDLNLKTVRRHLRADGVEMLLAEGVQAITLDAFKPYLHAPIADGQRNATVLDVMLHVSAPLGHIPERAARRRQW